MKKDFNSTTNYILKKRYRPDYFFIDSICDYLNKKFPEFREEVQNLRGTMSSSQIYDNVLRMDLGGIFHFLACLLYPKEFQAANDKRVKDENRN
jgi:hypothetical protein